jgi:hypothetical protein
VAAPDRLRAAAPETWTHTVIFFRAIEALDQSRVDPGQFGVPWRAATLGAAQPSSQVNLEVSATGIAQKGDFNNLAAEFGWKVIARTLKRAATGHSKGTGMVCGNSTSEHLPGGIQSKLGRILLSGQSSNESFEFQSNVVVRVSE